MLVLVRASILSQSSGASEIRNFTICLAALDAQQQSLSPHPSGCDDGTARGRSAMFLAAPFFPRSAQGKD